MKERKIRYLYVDEVSEAHTYIDGILVDIIPVLVPSEIDGRIITNIVGVVIPDNSIHNSIQLLACDEFIFS
jgi:hypothetical protein